MTRPLLHRALIVLALAVLVALVAPEPGFAAGKRPSATPATAMAGEKVVFKGRLATKVRRSVKLQVRIGGSWKTVKTARSSKKGAYRLVGRARSTAVSFRILAPKTKVSGKRYKALRTTTRKVAPARQSGWVTTNAPVAQAVSAQASNYASSLLRSPVQMTFRPVRPGRAVALQKWSGKTWKTVGQARQDSRGTALVTRPIEPGSRYRAVVGGWRGAAGIRTGTVTVPTWKTRFADDFRGSALDLDQWYHRNPNNEQIVSSRKASAVGRGNVTVSGGAANLYVKPITCGQSRTRETVRGKGCYSNAQIGALSGGNPFTLKHGVMAARVKFEKGLGKHGAFWLPDPEFDGPRGTEIDVVEYFGDNYPQGGLAHFTHADGKKHGGVINSNRLLRQGRSWSSDYHVFSAEWSPSGYVFRVDGHEVYRSSVAISREKQEVVLSLLSSDWEIKRLDRNRTARDPMKVDWVRVWQK